jgi:hypothetical protein
MVTTKRRVATKTAILKFNPDWIKDPPPPFFKNLDRVAIRELAAARKAFEAQVKQILAKAQR